MDGQLVGRSKHLARLATVFRHRHGTWADFGGFLKDYFERSAQEIPCRHNHRGRHHGFFWRARTSLTLPCSTMNDTLGLRCCGTLTRQKQRHCEHGRVQTRPGSPEESHDVGHDIVATGNLLG